MKSLIIGKGQVGSGLYEVLSPFHETYIKDMEDLELDGVEVLHICIPYTELFVEIVNKYIEQYRPTYAIIHSSVPIGTTDKLRSKWKRDISDPLSFCSVCYSPIRGRHPKLEIGIKTFTKFIAGNLFDVAILTKYFNDCGVNVLGFSEKEIKALEYSKLMSNIRYGYEICFMQEAERIAKNFGIDTEMFNEFEMTYNDGYKKLDEEKYIRPILHGGLIGGHCIMQNVDMLSSQYTSEMFDWMYFSNTKKKVESQINLTVLKGE